MATTILKKQYDTAVHKLTEYNWIHQFKNKNTDIQQKYQEIVENIKISKQIHSTKVRWGKF